MGSDGKTQFIVVLGVLRHILSDGRVESHFGLFSKPVIPRVTAFHIPLISAAQSKVFSKGIS